MNAKIADVKIDFKEGDVEDLIFDEGVMFIPALSINHYQYSLERTFGPVLEFVQESKDDFISLRKFRDDIEKLVSPYFVNNHIRQHYLMSRAKKIGSMKI